MKSSGKSSERNNDIIRNADASFHADGFHIRDAVRKDAHSVLLKKESANSVVLRYVNSYKKSK